MLSDLCTRDTNESASCHKGFANMAPGYSVHLHIGVHCTLYHCSTRTHTQSLSFSYVNRRTLIIKCE